MKAPIVQEAWEREHMEARLGNLWQSTGFEGFFLGLVGFGFKGV